LLADETPAALGDDVLAAERLRTLLYLAAPFAALVPQAARLLQSVVDGDDATPALALPEPSAYEPGVLDLGALPLLALAAARVGPSELGPIFVQTIHGLALAASAAEVLGRLSPELPGEAALQVIVHTLHLLETLSSALRVPYLRTFALDPVERGRWQSLTTLLEWKRLTAVLDAEPRWDGAHTREIESVLVARPPAAGEIEVSGRFALDELGALPSGVQLVFASARAVLPAKVLRITSSESGSSTIVAQVPAAAAPGWIGFSSDADIEASNAYRARLRQRLSEQFAEERSLVTTRVPAELVPDLRRADPARPGQLVSMPPRRAFNRFLAAAPVLTRVALEPSTLAPGAPFTLSWDSSGADEVLQLPSGVSLPARGELRLNAALEDGPFTLRLQPARTRDGERRLGAIEELHGIVQGAARIASVRLRQDGREAPLFERRPLVLDVTLDPASSRARLRLRLAPDHADAPPLEPVQDPKRGGLRFDVPASDVVAGLRLRLELSDASGALLERRELGPLRFGAPEAATLVLFLPALLGTGAGVAEAQARAALAQAAATRGLTLELVLLPWADDSLAVLGEAPESVVDPAVPQLLEVLARRALLTPGLEHALWLALFPGRAAVVSAPSAGSRAVAVSDLSGLGALLDAVWPPSTRAPVDAEPAPTGLASLALAASAQAPRLLRLYAQLGDDGKVLAHDVVLERRQRGAGGSVSSAELASSAAANGYAHGGGGPSPVSALLFDAGGHELVRHELRFVHAQLPRYIEGLLPANAQVAALELHVGGQRSLRVTRPDGELQLAGAELVEAPQPHVRWDALHTAGLQPRISLAVRSGNVVTPVATLDGCASQDRVWLDRLGPSDGLVLQVSDGWTLAGVDVEAPLEPHERLALRLLADGRWFAEAPDDWQITWRLNGQELATRARLLDLPAGAAGLIAIEARGPLGQVRNDARRLDRALL
jgi:hypothetical protein